MPAESTIRAGVRTPRGWCYSPGVQPGAPFPPDSKAPSGNPYQTTYASLDPSPEPVLRGDLPTTLVDAISRSRIWVFLLASLGLLGTAFSVFGALMMLMTAAFTPSYDNRLEQFPFWIAGCVYLFMAVIGGTPSFMLFRYGLAVNRVHAVDGMSSLEVAMRRLSQLWLSFGVAIIASVLAFFMVFLVLVIYASGQRA